MITPGLRLHLVPKTLWEKQENPQSDISEFVKDALAIERRLKKGVNQANERMRYRFCCRRIQAALSHFRCRSGGEVLSGSYFTILKLLYTDNRTCKDAVKSRIAACFFPPETISEYIKVFNTLTTRIGQKDNEEVMKRLAFLQYALDNGAGVIEAQEFYGTRGMLSLRKSDSVINGDVSSPEVSQHELLYPTDGHMNHSEAADELSLEKRRDMLTVLKSQIEQALQTGGEVNFSNQPHYVITEALNEYVYKNSPEQKEGTIRVVYMDGSEGRPFPLRCLERRPLARDLKIVPLKVSLVSMRHLAMDSQVHIAWFRNRDVSTPKPYAETDAFCASRTMELLKEITDREFYVHLYQTGLETAVVGFYRGLIQFLKSNQKGQLKVIPFYYRKKDDVYEQGNPWC